MLRLFADHGWAARVWFLIAALAVAAAFIQPFFIISAYRTQERVVILDETGTYHISPLLNFEDATKLQTSQTLLACLALLEKNPNGFDYPDLLEKMFLPQALNQAKAIQSQQADELKAKQIHQKVEVFRLDVLQTRNDQVWSKSPASSSASASSTANRSPNPKSFGRGSPSSAIPTSLPTVGSPSRCGNSTSSIPLTQQSL